jgi:hypothetical protein
MHTLNTKNYSVGDKIKFNIHQDRIIWVDFNKIDLTEKDEHKPIIH